MSTRRMLLIVLMGGVGLLMGACQFLTGQLGRIQAGPTLAAVVTEAAPQETEAAPQTTEAAPQTTEAATLEASTEATPPPLQTKTAHEDGESPAYAIDARWPALVWGTDPRAEPFNQAAEAYINEQVQDFKNELAQIPSDDPFRDSLSTLTIDFTPTSDAGGVLSVLFEVSRYRAGAAHPGGYAHALNYDLKDGKLLALADLFTPGSDYLNQIAAICKAELENRGVLEYAEGAAPTARNYQVWNITPEGLQITFDAYQVAAYAAGPQTVTIPAGQLQSIARPDGPLGAR